MFLKNSPISSADTCICLKWLCCLFFQKTQKTKTGSNIYLHIHFITRLDETTALPTMATTILSLDQFSNVCPHKCEDLSFDVQVQTPPLFPSVLALKHASSDLKPFAIPLYMFSAGSGSQKTSPFQTEGKGYKFSHSFKNATYTVQEIQIHLLEKVHLP